MHRLAPRSLVEVSWPPLVGEPGPDGGIPERMKTVMILFRSSWTGLFHEEPPLISPTVRPDIQYGVEVRVSLARVEPDDGSVLALRLDGLGGVFAS